MRKTLGLILLAFLLALTLLATYLIGCASRDRCPITRGAIAVLLIAGSTTGGE